MRLKTDLVLKYKKKELILFLNPVKMNLPSLKKIKKHVVNPFVIELKGRMYLQPRADTIIAKGQSIVDLTTGEILDDGVLIGKRKVVDKSQFAKIYASEISLLYELSNPAKNVFLYLTKVMDYENKAYFSYTQQYDKAGYNTHKAPLKGLQELISKNIIAPSSMVNVWWLNPAIVCKGERFAKYTEYVVGKEGTSSKDIAKGEIIKQERRRRDAQPQEIQEKYERATRQRTLFDSENEIIEQG